MRWLCGKGFAEIELLCLNSRESFEHNKQYLTSRMEQEPVPQIRALLEQDLRHLDEIQSRTATAREFVLLVRPRGVDEKEIYPYLNRLEKMIREQQFMMQEKAAGKNVLKTRSEKIKNITTNIPSLNGDGAGTIV